MSSRSVTSLTLPGAYASLVTPAGWGWIALLGALFVTLHYNFLWRMGRTAYHDPNWQHAMIVPLISLYFIFQHRERLMAATRQASPRGLLLLFVGIFCYASAIYPGQNDMLQGYSMILVLFGLVWFILGTSMLRYLWFPIAYLVFAVKVSDRLWNQIAWKLQDIAAIASAFLLKIFGMLLDMDVVLKGNTIELWNGSEKLSPLNVAEACSGLRMLMAFVALGVAMAFLSNRAWWQRLVMVAMAVPIAVLVNVGRVTVIGSLYAKVDPRVAAGDLHVFIGMLMLIPAAGVFWVLGWILDNVVISESQAAPSSAVETPAQGAREDFDRPHGPNAREPDNGSATIQSARGILVGAVLAIGAGLTYGAILISFDPTRFLEGLGLPSAIGVLLVAATLTVGAGWYCRRLVAPGRSATSTIAPAVAGGVMLVAVLGLNGVVYATQTVLFKQKIPLRHRLTRIPKVVGAADSDVGHWQMVGKDNRLPKDVEQVLGTNQYISRTYVDANAPRNSAESIIRLHVSYYTGTIGTVPHVPERCIAAGGALPVGGGVSQHVIEVTGPQYVVRSDDPSGVPIDDRNQPILARGQLAPEGTHIPSTRFTATRFRYTHEQTSIGNRSANVFYFFAANGRFLENPDRVRALAFDPRDRYSYYCKIEVAMPQVADGEHAKHRATAFLSVMLPEIMACLPDWVEVKRGTYPNAATGDT